MNRGLAARISLVLLGAMCALSAIAYFLLPADVMIPIHWGAGLQPDRFLERDFGLAALPLVGIGMAGILALSPREAEKPRLGALWDVVPYLAMAVIGSLTAVHVFSLALVLV